MADDHQRAGKYDGATVLGITEKRWDVRFHLRLLDGTETTLIASADSYYTDNNNVWFGTKEEWEGIDK